MGNDRKMSGSEDVQNCNAGRGDRTQACFVSNGVLLEFSRNNRASLENALPIFIGTGIG